MRVINGRDDMAPDLGEGRRREGERGLIDLWLLNYRHEKLLNVIRTLTNQ